MADVLVIHHNTSLRLTLLDQLRRSQHLLHGAMDIEHARSADRDCNVVVMGLPVGVPAPQALGQVRKGWPDAEIVVVGAGDVDAAAAALDHGAYDYLVLPQELTRLGDAVRAASDHICDELPHQPGIADGAPPASLDPAVREVYAKADRAAAVGSTILITGESGTGKEVLARRVHRLSARSRAKFVAVNCGSLPESLIETELFGYKRGAFTGANLDAKGLIEEAEHGVLFLDEIGDMPYAMQVRLLRFLDRGEIRAVGGTTARQVDVRVIAATNKCLEREVEEKRFRDDLFYRLSVVPLHLPPLRERKRDIAPLAHYHLRQIAARFRIQAPALGEDALEMLCRYPWPGNIRELQNAMEYALVECVGGRTITARDLPAAVSRPAGLRFRAAPIVEAPAQSFDILAILRRHNGNHGDAAAALGISRTTLWRRLRQLHATASAQPSVAVDSWSSVPPAEGS